MKNPYLSSGFGEQNGVSPDSSEELDPEPRYIRNARDLSRLAFTDTIYT